MEENKLESIIERAVKKALKSLVIMPWGDKGFAIEDRASVLESIHRHRRIH